jgi:REP element-mobilizing transposase RayT
MVNDNHDLAILDIEGEDPSVQGVLSDIVKYYPDLPMIVFPPQNDAKHSFVQGIPFKACLKKPFYLPDLLSAVDAALEGRAWVQDTGLPSSGKSDLTWLKEDLQPGSRLSNILIEDCLGVVFLTQGGPIIAKGGNLSPAAGAEIADLVNHSWREGQNIDMVRYFRLETMGEQLMLYVTMLDKPLLAALVFKADTSLMRARAVAVQAVRSLHDGSSTGSKASEPSEVGAGAQENKDVDNLQSDDDSGEDEPVDPRLLELIDYAPSPEPFKINLDDHGEWQLEQDFLSNDPEEIDFPWERKQAQPDIDVDGHTEDEQFSDLPPLGFFNPTSYSGDNAAERKRQIYTCILIPRLADNRLEGNLAEELRNWIPPLCKTLGWNLRNLVILPEMLQWTVDVSEDVSPGSLVRDLRHKSTQHIANRFQGHHQETEQEDFWAPGFLVVRGPNPPETHLLQNFILQTRRRQGHLPPE